MSDVAEEVKSTHKVEVVPLVLDKHPNADRLSVAKVFGFTCVTETSQWDGKSLAAYLPPDSVVDVNRPEFSFLAKHAKSDGKARIRAMKLRGVLSFGLLVPAPDGAREGDDVAELLGVTHYEAPVRGAQSPGGLFTGGEVAPAPGVYMVKYDLEAGRRYALNAFVPGEPVMVTEKIHGANARYVFWDGRMHCGSRAEWKKEFPSYDHVTVESLLATGKVDLARAEEIVAGLKRKSENPQKNLWWQALDSTPALRAFCESHPGVVVYGEVYGAVQDLSYGHERGRVSFAAFDVMEDGRWLDAHPSRLVLVGSGVPVVPAVHLITDFDFNRVCESAEGRSLVIGADHVREGVVVKPLKERYDDVIGRVCLKWVGAGYLEKSK